MVIEHWSWNLKTAFTSHTFILKVWLGSKDLWTMSSSPSHVHLVVTVLRSTIDWVTQMTLGGIFLDLYIFWMNVKSMTLKMSTLLSTLHWATGTVRLLVESFYSPSESNWSSTGVHQKSNRSLPGVHQESIRSPWRVQLESTRSPSGVHEESNRSLPGVHLESIRSSHRLT
jgi:hypothetical protein